MTVLAHTMTKVEEDSFHSLCAEFDLRRMNGWQNAQDEHVVEDEFAAGEYEDFI